MLQKKLDFPKELFQNFRLDIALGFQYSSIFSANASAALGVDIASFWMQYS